MTEKSPPNPLIVTHPEVAAQWHPDKNGTATADQVIARSANRYWWLCPEGPDHEWEAGLSHRTTQGRGCPFCSGNRVSVTNSLASLYPEVAENWHPTKNFNITPDLITASTSKSYWWRCPNGPDHEWDSSPKSLTLNGKGCPFCRGFKASVTNSLGSLYPNLAQNWHTEKNGETTPDQIVAGSEKKYWWKCPEGSDHEWQAAPKPMIRTEKGCPFCRGLQVSDTNSLALYPDVAQGWHPYKNGDITPDKIVAGSEKKYWWKCPEGSDHEWFTSPKMRTSSTHQTACPFCDGKKVSTTNSLASLFPKITDQWHQEKNGGLTPDQVVAGSHTKCWWICPEGPDHEWNSSAGSRTGRGDGCPFCAGKKVSITNSLATLFPDIAGQWHPEKNEALTPDKVVSGSNKHYWWKCPEGSDHEWRADPSRRTLGEFRCPFCTGKRVSVTNSLATLFPDLAVQWHPHRNGEITPDKIIAGTHKRYWWICPNGPDHEWLAGPDDRIYKESGCPYCSVFPRSKQEIALAFELLHIFDFDIDDHKVKSGDLLHDCDIIIRDHRLIVEFDGAYWHEGHDDYDLEKTTALQEAGWNVIRVRERPLVLISSMDISVPKRGETKPIVDAVLFKVRDNLNIQLESLDDYLKGSALQNAEAGEAYIRRSLHPNQKRPLTAT